MIYQFKVETSIIEIRHDLQKLVSRGTMEENDMRNIIHKVGEQKKKIENGQRFIAVRIGA